MHASHKVNHFLKYLVLTFAFVVLCSLQPKRPCGGSDVVRLRAYQRNYGKLQPLHLTVRPGHVLTSCRHFCTDEGVCRPIKFEQRRLRFLEKFCGEQRVALSGPALLFLKPSRFTLQCSKTANSFEVLSQGPIWLDVHRVRMMSGTDSPTAVSQHTRASPANTGPFDTNRFRRENASSELLVHYVSDPLSVGESRYFISHIEFRISQLPEVHDAMRNASAGNRNSAQAVSVRFVPTDPNKDPRPYLVDPVMSRQVVHAWSCGNEAASRKLQACAHYIPQRRSVGELASLWMLILGVIILAGQSHYRGARRESPRSLKSTPQGHNWSRISRQRASSLDDGVHHIPVDCEHGVHRGLDRPGSTVARASHVSDTSKPLESASAFGVSTANTIEAPRDSDMHATCARIPTPAWASRTFLILFLILQNSAMAFFYFIGIFCPPSSCVKLVAIDVATALACSVGAACCTELWSLVCWIDCESGNERASIGEAQDVPLEKTPPDVSAHAANVEPIATSVSNGKRAPLMDNYSPGAGSAEPWNESASRGSIFRTQCGALPRLAARHSERLRLLERLNFNPLMLWIFRIFQWKRSTFWLIRDTNIIPCWFTGPVIYYLGLRLLITLLLWSGEPSRPEALFVNLQAMIPVFLGSSLGAKVARSIRSRQVPRWFSKVQQTEIFQVSPARILQVWFLVDVLLNGWFYPGAGRPLPFTLIFRLPRACAGDFLDNLTEYSNSDEKLYLAAYQLLPWYGWNAICKLFAALVLFVEA